MSQIILTKQLLLENGFVENPNPEERKIFMFSKEILPANEENDTHAVELIIHRIYNEVNLAIAIDGVIIDLVVTNPSQDFAKAEEFCKMIKSIDLP